MKRIPVKIVYGFCSTKSDGIPFPQVCKTLRT